MKVQVKMDDVTITLGNKGVVLQIADNAGKHVGNLRIGQATAEWMKGKTRNGNGKKIAMQDLVKLLDAQ